MRDLSSEMRRINEGWVKLIDDAGRVAEMRLLSELIDYFHDRRWELNPELSNEVMRSPQYQEVVRAETHVRTLYHELSKGRQ